MPTVTITQPHEAPRRIDISANRETTLFGRSSKCDVRLTCESVSARHATLRRLRDGYVLRDLDSTNGTKLGGEKVSEIRLQPGQRIHLGDVTFQFEPDPGVGTGKNDSRERLPPLKEELPSKPEPEPTPKPHPQTQKDPVIWGLSLMGSGLVVVGFIVLIGMEAIRAIPERDGGFLVSGIVLIVAGLLCLGSILIVIGRIRLPKLVVRFGEDEDEDPAPRRKRRNANQENPDLDNLHDEADKDSGQAGIDCDGELGRAPKDKESKDSAQEA